MSAAESQISPTDTAKILALIQEYADKLRVLCVAYVDARAKRQQAVLMSATFLSVIMAASSLIGRLYLPDADLNSSTLVLIAAVLSSSVFILPLLWAGSLRRSRDLYDVHQVALTVERLLRTASQYSEHAAQALGDKFEFDIRLAEAEAALHVYRNVFQDSEKRTSGFGRRLF